MNFTKQQRNRLVDHYDPTSLINKLIEDCDELEKELLASRESKSATPDVYSEHCPHCDSENITMIGDPEYNDEWYCRRCKKTFGSFKGKVNGKTL